MANSAQDLSITPRYLGFIPLTGPECECSKRLNRLRRRDSFQSVKPLFHHILHICTEYFILFVNDELKMLMVLHFPFRDIKHVTELGPSEHEGRENGPAF